MRKTRAVAKTILALPALLAWLAVPASADEALSGLVREPPAVSAQAAVKALPTETQTELFTLYARYNDMVSRRIDEGWRAGLLSDEGTKASQEDNLPARQLEESISNREAEIKALNQKLAKPETAADGRLRRQRDAAEARLVILRGALSRIKGTCRDWSDSVWAELGRLQPKHWSLNDRERTVRPFHTGAALCSPSDSEDEAFCSEAAPERCPAAGHKVCLVFDPWQRGRADVYELGAWDQEPFAGRLPAEFFLHELPEPRPARAPKTRR